MGSGTPKRCVYVYYSVGLGKISDAANSVVAFPKFKNKCFNSHWS